MVRRTAKDKHLETLVRQFVTGDQAAALRHYTSNRISPQTFAEARRKAAKILASFEKGTK